MWNGEKQNPYCREDVCKYQFMDDCLPFAILTCAKKKHLFFLRGVGGGGGVYGWKRWHVIIGIVFALEMQETGCNGSVVRWWVFWFCFICLLVVVFFPLLIVYGFFSIVVLLSCSV